MFVVLRMFLYSMSMTLTSPIELTKLAWADYKKHLRTIVTILLIPNLLSRFAGQMGGHYQVNPSPFSFIIVLAMIVLSIWSQITIFMAIVYPNDKFTFAQWYNRSWKYIWSYCWLLFISSAIIFSGVILFVIPGIIFSIWFSMGIFVLIDRKLTGLDALQGSTELVKGHWFAVLWRVLVAGLISLVASIMVSILVNILHLPYHAEISGVIIATFVTPFVYMYTFKVYNELKALKGEYTFVRSNRYSWSFLAIAIAGIFVIPALIIILSIGNGLKNTRKNIDSTKYKMEQLQNDQERQMRKIQEN